MNALARGIGVGLLPVFAVACGTNPTRRAPEAEPVRPISERMAGVPHELLPALEALQRATDAGDDVEARSILARLLARNPTGDALSIARAYERILDGRAVVSGLKLRLECRPETPKEIPKGAPRDARYARLYLVAEETLGFPVDVQPGAATLLVTTSIVDRACTQRDSSETRGFGNLKPLHVEPGRPAVIPLALFFLAVGERELAVRMSFDLTLSSGVATLHDRPGDPLGPGRELPAMRLRVASAEEFEVSSSLPTAAGDPFEVSPEGLARLARKPGLQAREALDVAVRLGAFDAQALDLLATVVEEIPLVSVAELVPALRWMAHTSAPGADPDAWRAWLRARAAKPGEERPRLLLPQRPPPPGLTGG